MSVVCSDKVIVIFREGYCRYSIGYFIGGYYDVFLEGKLKEELRVCFLGLRRKRF